MKEEEIRASLESRKEELCRRDADLEEQLRDLESVLADEKIIRAIASFSPQFYGKLARALKLKGLVAK